MKRSQIVGVKWRIPADGRVGGVENLTVHQVKEGIDAALDYRFGRSRITGAWAIPPIRKREELHHEWHL